MFPFLKGTALPGNKADSSEIDTYAAENDGYHCPLHTQCLKENATYKKLERWEHEALVDQPRAQMEGIGGHFSLPN